MTDEKDKPHEPQPDAVPGTIDIQAMAATRPRGIMERLKGSGIWWVRWTDHLGKRHLEKAGKRVDAEVLYAKRQYEKLQRKKLPERFKTAAVTWKEIAADALEHSKAENKAQTAKELEIKLKYIAPDFDHREASAITPSDIKAWLLKQSTKKAWTPATRNRYQAAFSLVFRVAIDNDKLTVNPASKVETKAENNDRIRFLSAPEQERLEAAIRKHYPHQMPSFLLSLHTGMRAAEQFNLKWQDVRLDTADPMISLHETKGGKTRHIPLNVIAVAALKEIQKQTGNVSGYMFEHRSVQARAWFNRCLERAEIHEYTWHCNRHTFASRLVMGGADIRTVQELLGHHSITLTMRYSHLAPEHRRSTVNLLVTRSVTDRRDSL